MTPISYLYRALSLLINVVILQYESLVGGLSLCNPLYQYIPKERLFCLS